MVNGPSPFSPGNTQLREFSPGESAQHLPRRLTEQNVPRASLRVNQREPIRLDLAPAQAAYHARPASTQEDEPHRRDPDRTFGFEPSQGCAELGEIVRTEQPPPRWTAEPGDAR